MEPLSDCPLCDATSMLTDEQFAKYKGEYDRGYRDAIKRCAEIARNKFGPQFPYQRETGEAIAKEIESNV